MLGARLSVPFFSFGINIAVARLLGSHVLGQYVELVALLLIAQALAGGGISVLLTREVAAHPDERAELVRRANRVGLVTGLLATGIFLVYARLVLAAEMQPPALVMAASILPSAWIAAQEGLFMGVQDHPRVTLVALVEGMIKLALAAAVLALGAGLIGLCAGLTLGRFASFGLGQVLARRAGAVRAFARPASDTLAFAWAAIPFTATMTLGILYFRQDVLVIGAMRSESETGLYGVAITLYAITLLAPNSVMAALYPRISATFATARENYHPATILTSKLLTASGAVLSLLVIAFSPLAVQLIYGADYLEAVPVLMLLAIILPLHGLNAALGQAMQAAHLQNEMTYLAAGAVVVNLGLNLVLVPTLGIRGAALSLLISSTLSALVLGWIYHRRVEAFRLGLRGPSMALAVILPMALPLLVPVGLRLPAALLGLPLLALGARVSGLVSAQDIARIRGGMVPGARPTSPPA